MVMLLGSPSAFLNFHSGRGFSTHDRHLPGLEAMRAQALAQQAGFLAAEARVHHLARNYAAALRCFLQTSAAAAFEYLEATLGSPDATAAETDSIWGAVQSALPELVAADSLVLARLVLARFPGKHSGVIYSLQGSPELQFRCSLLVFWGL